MYAEATEVATEPRARPVWSAPPRTERLVTERVLGLQRAAGNAAVARLVAGRTPRQAVTRCGASCRCRRCGGHDQQPDEVMRAERSASMSRLLRAAITARATSPTLARSPASLDSPRFAGEPLLEACFEDRARMDVGARDTATEQPVSKVQQALIDRGFDVGPSGADGIYGAKTAAAVRAFKTSEHLGSEQFGDVGPGTMHRLNELFPQATPPGPPSPTPPTPPAPSPTPPAPPAPTPTPPTPPAPSPTPPTPPGPSPTPTPPAPAPAPSGRTPKRPTAPSGPTPRRPAPPSAPAKKNCATYEVNPDERKQSLGSPGAVGRSGTFGKDLTLSNFGAGQSRMKREHEDALRQLIRDFDLANPLSEFEVEFTRGFTDAVDSEDKNEALRRARADDVQFVLKQNGVPGAPDGTAADVTSYDNGCTPATHSLARRVVVQVRKKAIRPTLPPEPKPPREPDKPGGVCNTLPSRIWSLRGNGSIAPSKSLAAAGVWSFTLTDRASGLSRLLSFRGKGGSLGVSFPATVGIDTPTDFETTFAELFEGFEGGGGLFGGEIGFVVGFAIGRAVMHPQTKPSEISTTGFQLSGGVDVSFIGGTWFFDPVAGAGCFKARPGLG